MSDEEEALGPGAKKHEKASRDAELDNASVTVPVVMAEVDERLLTEMEFFIMT